MTLPAPGLSPSTAGDPPAYRYDSQGALFGERRVIGFGSCMFYVEEIQRDLANKIITENHYSRKVYSASTIHLGVFRLGVMVGVLQFGYALNPASMGGVVTDTAIDEYLELNRMWLSDEAPRNSESRSIAHAIAYIRRAHRKVAWIQSFADERCRRFVVVYQACNFLYCGEHLSTFWELDGVWYHNIMMTAKGETHKGSAFLQENRSRATAHELRQFRYIFFLKPRYRRRLRLPVLPYPKHAPQTLG